MAACLYPPNSTGLPGSTRRSILMDQKGTSVKLFLWPRPGGRCLLGRRQDALHKMVRAAEPDQAIQGRLRWRTSGASTARMKQFHSPQTGLVPRPIRMVWDGRVLIFFSDRESAVKNVWSMDSDGHGARQESHQHIYLTCNPASSVRRSRGLRFGLRSLDARFEERARRGYSDHAGLRLRPGAPALGKEAARQPHQRLHTALQMASVCRVHSCAAKCFYFPAKPGRIVRVAGDSAVRYRDAAFLPDGKSIVALSTADREKPNSGSLPRTEKASPSSGQLHDAKVLRDGRGRHRPTAVGSHIMTKMISWRVWPTRSRNKTSSF